MLSHKLSTLERLGRHKEATDLIISSQWYRCGNLYYKPSSDIILDGNKTIHGKLNLKDCYKVPFNQIDIIEAKVGITNISTPIGSNANVTTRKRCCR